jgi:tetratricopeptide (TPR) repeat protein
LPGIPGSGDRPGLGKPDIGGNRPGIGSPGDRPGLGKPGLGGGERPGERPSTLPGVPGSGGGLPGLGKPGDRPGLGKPGLGGGERPGERPSTLPGVPGSGGGLPGLGKPGDRPGLCRPEIGDRPGLGGDRPGLGKPGPGGDRPGIGDGGRPGIGIGNRPGTGIGDRPGIGGGDRPGIGIGNRPGIGNGGNNNIIINRPGGDNNLVIGNRPGRPGGGNWNGYRPGFGHRPGPDWGYRPGNGGWGGYWRDHRVNHHHHHWYHGCWGGHWSSSWYVPFTFGVTAWRLSAALPSWGYSYGYVYTNPYYVPTTAVAAPAYDYSQPIVINTYNSPTAEAAADASNEQPVAPSDEDSPAAQAGYLQFDQAVEAFQGGDYRRALELTESAIQSVPNDPVLHEFGALCLFALGDYARCAAVLNALLAVAPGMDWTTMSSLYSDVDQYTVQLRKLEAFSKQNPDDSGAHFVLAYHYMVAGHKDAAVRQLQQVVAKEPDDQVAKRILDALTAQDQAGGEAAAPASPPATGVADTVGAAETSTEETEAQQPYTDLVGRWLAARGEDRFGLIIGEDGAFTWAAIPAGQERVTLTGQAATSDDMLLLETDDQGTMAGRVKSGGPDKFQFIPAGGPPDDEGLTFQRAAETE